MKKAIFSSIFIFAAFCGVFSQDKPVKFTVTVSTDSILMDNYFEVKFVLENADGQNFEAPDFNEHFNVVSGPNFSTSMSIMNGNITQNMTITYYLEPKDVGNYYIMPASVKAKGEVLETAPLEVMVVPNPDGIKQSLPKHNSQNLQFNFGDNPFDFDFSFPNLNEFHQFSYPEPKGEQEKPKQEEQPVKKKAENDQDLMKKPVQLDLDGLFQFRSKLRLLPKISRQYRAS
ncbi:MAG: BatD family protein [Saprospiraceae bacterium]|nr:BatD family protein [Saprospiraceae bacterium]